ncbi:MAG: hypothetical protein ACFBSC_15005 [Microcoleaceae cyanobacterium]
MSMKTLRYGLIALISLLVVTVGSLLSTPATATTGHGAGQGAGQGAQVHIWDYASLTNPQMVCKQVSFAPKSSKGSDVPSMNVRSMVVNNQYCQGLKQPQHLS